MLVLGIMMHLQGRGTARMWRGSSHPRSPSVFPTRGRWRSADRGRQTSSYLPRPSLAAMRWSKSVSLLFFVPLSRFRGRSPHCLQC